MSDVVCIESKLWEVKDGKFRQILIETGTEQVKFPVKASEEGQEPEEGESLEHWAGEFTEKLAQAEKKQTELEGEITNLKEQLAQLTTRIASLETSEGGSEEGGDNGEEPGAGENGDDNLTEPEAGNE